MCNLCIKYHLTQCLPNAAKRQVGRAKAPGLEKQESRTPTLSNTPKCHLESVLSTSSHPKRFDDVPPWLRATRAAHTDQLDPAGGMQKCRPAGREGGLHSTTPWDSPCDGQTYVPHPQEAGGEQRVACHFTGQNLSSGERTDQHERQTGLEP